MSEPLINKVADSGLVTLDPDNWVNREPIALFDLKDYLFRELILKEKDFRESLKNKDWEIYRDQHVAVTCSADAIIPVWAYMLIATYLQPVARSIFMGTEAEMRKHLFLKNLENLQADDYRGKKMVIKGCGDNPVPDYVYMEITKKLLPGAQSIMYGEPCSTVPVYKNRVKS